MKSILPIAFLILFMNGFGQSLVVTADGLRDSADAGKSFVVLKVDSASARLLYDNAKKYINKTYENPSDVIKAKVENEYVKFITHKSDITSLKNGWATLHIDGDYTVELNFKDGKAKYEVVALDMYNPNGGYKLQFSGGISMSYYPIYNGSGELKHAEAKRGLEEYFNSEIQSILGYLNGSIGSPKKENW